MGKGDIILNSSDFNRTIEEMEHLTENLFNLKNIFTDFDSNIKISKDELDSKLEAIDSYLIKVANIQKQIIGDRGIDTKFKTQLNKIDKLFEQRLVSLLGIEKRAIDNLNEKVPSVEQTLKNLQDEYKKTFEDSVKSVKKDKEEIEIFLKQINKNLDIKNIKIHANTLETASLSMLKIIEEYQNFEKFKPFMIGSVIFFIIGFALGHYIKFFI